MGIDAVILIRSKTPEPNLEWGLLKNFSIQPVPELYREDFPDATHEVDCGGIRLYRPGYENGAWPHIAATLIELLASEDVEKVWYGGDSSPPQEISADQVNVISSHYMEHGRRPFAQRVNPGSSPDGTGC